MSDTRVVAYAHLLVTTSTARLFHYEGPVFHYHTLIFGVDPFLKELLCNYGTCFAHIQWTEKLTSRFGKLLHHQFTVSYHTTVCHLMTLVYLCSTSMLPTFVS